MTRKEIARLGAIAKHKKYSQTGKNNPNWRDGISKELYRYKKEYKQKFPEKVKAGEILHKAIVSGKIKKMCCVICGEKAEGHHEDYGQPLKVKWLCRKHHKEAHGGTFKRNSCYPRP